jgi:hypothetical protein
VQQFRCGDHISSAHGHCDRDSLPMLNALLDGQDRWGRLLLAA